MQHFDGRLVSGAIPCSSGHQAEMLVWLRHSDRTVAASAVGLRALADVLPPAIFGLLKERIPISTVTWAVDFFDDYPLRPGG